MFSVDRAEPVSQPGSGSKSKPGAHVTAFIGGVCQLTLPLPLPFPSPSQFKDLAIEKQTSQLCCNVLMWWKYNNILFAYSTNKEKILKTEIQLKIRSS